MNPSMLRLYAAARRKQSRSQRLQTRTQLLVIAAAVTTVAVTLYSGDNDPGSFTRSMLGLVPHTEAHVTRKLLSATSSCGETPEWEKNGGIVGYFVGVFFMFLGIAIVCDDFFVPALEKICEVLRLSDDVAGATFMAAGSSAPELAASAMSLINPSAGSEIGVGTIVGSAIFNILIIIGATVIATGKDLQLDWKPVTRDCFFYAAAIAGIVGTFAGGRVDWWEGAVYVGFYLTYIVTMMYNVRLMRWLDSFERSKRVQSFKARLSFRSERDLSRFRQSEDLGSDTPHVIPDSPNGSPPNAEHADENTETKKDPKQLWARIRDDVVKVRKNSFAEIVLATGAQWRAKQAVIVDGGGEVGGSGLTGDGSLHFITPTMTLGHIRAYRAEAIKAAKTLAARDARANERAAAIAKAIEEGSIADDGSVAALSDVEFETNDENDASPWHVPANKKEWPLWALSLPWYAAFQLTIPPCANPRWEKWYTSSFAMSIVWIGFITHWMVEWCVRIGCILHIPAVVMGTTVLAAGTSIPDALSSIAVARDGLADMAVANAVGSNVFDIWLGLGLPWLLYLSWQTPNYILVNTDELIPSSIILAGVLVVYYASIASNGFKLTMRMGYTFIAIYGVYVVYSIVLVWLLDVYGLENAKK